MSHEHDHEHSDGHAHPHSHTHTHSHEHTHDHTHEHAAPSGLEETKALLAYMIQHNEHHAEELADLVDALPRDVQKQMLTAIGAFEAANIDLQGVLDRL